MFGSGMVPEHGIFQAGWALAVAVDLARASGDAADREDVRRRAMAVEAALRGSRSGFLESYPGQYWPCDTVVAASALAAAAVLLDRPDWLATVRAWRAGRWPGRSTRPPGCCRTGSTPTGRALEGPRGSSQSVIQAFWPAIGLALDGRRDAAELAGLPPVVRGPRGRAGRRTRVPASAPTVPATSTPARCCSASAPAPARSPWRPPGRSAIAALAEDLSREAELLGPALTLGRGAPVRPRRPAGRRRLPGLGADPPGRSSRCPTDVDADTGRPWWPPSRSRSWSRPGVVLAVAGPAVPAYPVALTGPRCSLGKAAVARSTAVRMTLAGDLPHWPRARRGGAGQHRLHRHPGAAGHRRPAGDRFRVVGLAAGGSQIPLLARQVLDTGAALVAVSHSTAVQDLQLALYAEASRRGWASGEFRLPRIVSGPDAAREAATMPCDVVLNGITGATGLAATLAALATGRTLALANKESLVIGGPLVTRAAAPGQIVAVDSEHSALAQCLRGGSAGRGGPAGADRQRRTVPRPDPGPDADGDPGGGAGPPDLVHGPGDHHELRDAGQQGTGAAGGAPALRRSTWTGSTWWCTRSRSCTPWCSSSTARPWPSARRRTCGCRSRWRSAGRSGSPGWPPPATGPPPRAGPSSRWTPRRSRRWSWPGRPAGWGGSAPAVYNAANEECVEAFHAGQIGFLDICDIIAEVLAEHVRSGGDVGHNATGSGEPGADVGSTLVADDDLSLDLVLAADAWARGGPGSSPRSRSTRARWTP